MSPITNISQLDPKGTYTYADYLTWRFDQMVELIKGKLFMLSPAPAERHQRISMQLGVRIGYHFLKHPCSTYFAPFDVRLVKNKTSNDKILTVVQPDICVICDKEKIDERGCIGSPDWIIEISSPSTAKKDLNEKYNLYEENGVREYWVVLPEANVINQYVLQDGVYVYIDAWFKGQTITPSIFPDLQITMDDIFE